MPEKNEFIPKDFSLYPLDEEVSVFRLNLRASTFDISFSGN